MPATGIPAARLIGLEDIRGDFPVHPELLMTCRAVDGDLQHKRAALQTGYDVGSCVANHAFRPPTLSTQRRPCAQETTQVPTLCRVSGPASGPPDSCIVTRNVTHRVQVIDRRERMRLQLTPSPAKRIAVLLTGDCLRRSAQNMQHDLD